MREFPRHLDARSAAGLRTRRSWTSTLFGRASSERCAVGGSRSEFPPGYGYLLGTDEGQCPRSWPVYSAWWAATRLGGDTWRVARMDGPRQSLAPAVTGSSRLAQGVRSSFRRDGGQQVRVRTCLAVGLWPRLT